MGFLRYFASAVTLTTGAVGYGLISGNEKFYSDYAMPCVQKVMDGESAHKLAIAMAKYGLVPSEKKIDNENILRQVVFNKEFKNPIGCAAGFDKNAEGLNGLFKIGFGFVEIGSVTPLPQEGNPKPRVFRLTEDRAVINRYGFNSDGLEIVEKRIKDFKEDTRNKDKVLGINIGKNKLSTDAVNDYLIGIRAFAEYADYLVINISSPNTPGLRDLQHKEELKQLIDPILDLRTTLRKDLPVLVKIAPDLTYAQMKDIADVLVRSDKSVDGIIVSNTTIDRPESLKSENKNQTGGLSGRPLKDKSNTALKNMYELTQGKVVLIGVGGIENGQDALEKLKSGASLVQLYTSMVYEGPVIVNKIKRELVDLLRQEGVSNINEVIGSNSKISKRNKIK